MALKRPPQHRANAEPIYVHFSDDAWDHARIETDMEAMKRDGQDPSQHPVALYWSGSTRYDLHARVLYGNDSAPATDWLDMKKACLFTLRRLDPGKFARVQARKEAASRKGESDYENAIDSCRWTLAKCEGPGAPKLSGRGELSDRDIAELTECFGAPLVWALGDAGYLASIPLTDDEKKAFAS